jgi:hypothetical protein
MSASQNLAAWRSRQQPADRKLITQSIEVRHPLDKVTAVSCFAFSDFRLFSRPDPSDLKD